MVVGIILANGFEDIEAIVPIDILRRGNVNIQIISSNDNNVVISSKGVSFLTDDVISNCKENCFDLIILPGGMSGATNLFNSKELDLILKDMNAKGKYIAAICASPVVVLAAKGLLGFNKFTCYPDLEKNVLDGEFVDKNVVISNNFITSKGVGTSFEFAFTLLEIVKGKQIMENVKKATLLCKS
ncbi:DJ-1 family glyoxalase III [Borreliella americana]|uniref:DJ-1 family glyoxalase III n=1 Tax=Borreliella americana TaxID=478807 RepID=UPI001E3E0BA0|nr:DJ-1 family glyoxalase III [Borreliella americana]MCD2332368.1 DJ-1/PfpI family protein [Borreliella americana]MCD2349683.1 DJ-1/PfpI family protein [Borreliella americana]MCD2381870.1 DJ-1/PfpI family protein [Borreliella americana]